jgi:hypothetical protein
MLTGSGAITPYGRAEALLLKSSGGGAASGTGNSYGAFAGLDFGITEAASVFMEGGYGRQKFPGASESQNQTLVNLGLTIRF